MKTVYYSFIFTLCTLLCVSANAQISGSRVKSVEGKSYEITHIYNSRITQEVKDIIAPYKPGVDSLVSPIVGESAQYMEASRPESLLSNLLADILLETSKKYGKQADIAIGNIGGTRSILPAGKVTVGDILEIAPFQNYYTILKLKGADLLRLMEQIASRNGEGLSRGVKLVIENRKMKSFTLNGKQINPEKVYTIATIDYVAEGNDGMSAIKNYISRMTTDIPVRDVYMEYFKKLYKKGKVVDSALDGRVVVENEQKTDKEVVKLLVAHTNDTHSCIESINPNSSDKDKAGKAGYMRRTVLVDSLRHVDADMLLFDVGDFSQGSAYYNLYKGEVEVKFMNYMKYDACTIGNHEFDYGLENMNRIFTMMDFPVVCCNYDFSATCLKDVVKPYAIIERKGVKVGITGVGTALKGLVPDSKCVGVVYNDPAECVEKVSKYLKEEEHCDIVICLSHLGASSDEKLIAKTSHIDAVIGGHSHTLFAAPKFIKNAVGREIVNNQQGKNAQFVGTLTFNIEK